MSYHYIINDKGQLEYKAGMPTSAQLGSFTGRAGSLRRSRKGRSTRVPNGRRNYLIEHDSNVVAYKV